jgi:hypothetical protein
LVIDPLSEDLNVRPWRKLGSVFEHGPEDLPSPGHSNQFVLDRLPGSRVVDVTQGIEIGAAKIPPAAAPGTGGGFAGDPKS